MPKPTAKTLLNAITSSLMMEVAVKSKAMQIHNLKCAKLFKNVSKFSVVPMQKIYKNQGQFVYMDLLESANNL